MKDYKITRAKFFDSEQRSRLMEITEGLAMRDRSRGRKTWQRRWMLVNLALHSGLRLSEITNLKIGCIHFDKGGGYISVLSGKGGKDRDVYFDDGLGAHLKDSLPKKLRCGTSPMGLLITFLPEPWAPALCSVAR